MNGRLEEAILLSSSKLTILLADMEIHWRCCMTCKTRGNHWSNPRCGDEMDIYDQVAAERSNLEQLRESLLLAAQVTREAT